MKLSDVLIGDGLAIRKRLAADLGSPDLADHLFAWLQPRLAEMSTLTLDEARTRQSQDQAADEVEEVYVTFEPGQTLAKAGEPLGPKQLDLLAREHAEVDAQRTAPQKAARATGVWAIIVGLFALCALYMNRRERRLLANFKRLTTMLLLAMATVVAARWASHDPWRAELVPMLLFGEIVAIAYHQEVALLLSGVVALILVLAIGLGLGEFLVLFGVTATAILQLGFIRSRGKLIYVGFNSGVVAVSLTIGVAVIDNQPLGWTTLSDAARNGGLTLAAGFLMTGLLPLIERLFGVLTDISLLGTGRRRPSALAGTGPPGPEHVQPLDHRRHDRRGGRRRHRRPGTAGPRRRLFSRHRQDAQAGLFHRKPGRRSQSPRDPRARHEQPGHHRPHQGRRESRPAASPARAHHRLHPPASRHDAGRLFLRAGQPAEQAEPGRAARSRRARSAIPAPSRRRRKRPC